MIPVSITINGQNFSPVITDLSFQKEVTYENIITTMDGKEHCLGRRIRPIIEFNLMLTPASTTTYYTKLTTSPVTVSYTDPDLGQRSDVQFRLDCNLSKVFELRNSVNSNDYYSSGTIRLRALEVV